MAQEGWKIIGHVSEMANASQGVKRAQQPIYSIGQIKTAPPQDSWPELIGKSALKGLTSLGDIPSMVGQGIEGAVNFGRRMEVSPEQGDYIPGHGYVPKYRINPNAKQTDYSRYIPDTGDVRKGLNNYMGIDLEPHPSNENQRMVAHGAEFAGALTPWGLAKKGVNLAGKGINAAKAAGTGASIGLTSGAMQEQGVNPITADIAATFAHPTPKGLIAAFKKGKETATKIPMQAMGLGPKSINLEAAKAAQDLGIDLPASALTDSKLTGLMDQFVGKTPYFGNKLGNKYAKAQEQTKEALEDIYEQVGPKRTPEVEAQRQRLYDLRTKELPEGAAIKPTHLDAAIDNIKIDSAILSDDEKKLLNSLETIKKNIRPESKLVSNLGPIKMPLSPLSIQTLMGTKTSLNNIIKWDTKEGVRDQLRKVQHAVAEDLAEYGKQNPSWYKRLVDADKFYASVAKREKLENQLGKSINPSTGDLGYAALSKGINAPKQAKLMKHELGKEVYAKIDKLGKVSRAMAVKNRAIPNPSGTAPTAAIIGYLGNAYSPETLGAIVGTAAATKLLTDKKFLDLAIKYAENPTKSGYLNSMAINRRIKELTGISPSVLSREIKKAEEEQDGL